MSGPVGRHGNADRRRLAGRPAVVISGWNGEGILIRVEMCLEHMTGTTIDTIGTLLESAVDETDESEVRFKLRTALQLLTVIDREHDTASKALENAELEPGVREDLRELGYVD
jgi:hypothetical protein